MIGPGLRARCRELCVLAAAMLAVWLSVSPAWADDTVTWQVTPAGSHHAPGTYFVTAGTPSASSPPPSAQSSPSATPPPTQTARIPGSLKLVIGVVAIAFGVTVARRASRKQQG